MNVSIIAASRIEGGVDRNPSRGPGRRAAQTARLIAYRGRGIFMWGRAAGALSPVMSARLSGTPVETVQATSVCADNWRKILAKLKARVAAQERPVVVDDCRGQAASERAGQFVGARKTCPQFNAFPCGTCPFAFGQPDQEKEGDHDVSVASTRSRRPPGATAGRRATSRPRQPG